MIRSLWRVVNKSAYRRAMSGERSPNAVEPIRTAHDLDEWVNMWVAVKAGKVIAAAYNSHDLVRQVIEMGPNATGAVAQFVPKRTDAVVIGVG